MGYPIDWGKTAELIGFITGIIALGVGVWHVSELHRALDKIRNVEKSLSTRYLGNFPIFLPDIVDLVNSAKDSVIVFCDFPGYGDFSDPVHALDYIQALERKFAENVTIEVTCLDAASRARFLQDQFPEAQWAEWQKDEAKSERMLKFLTTNAKLPDPSKAKISDLISAMHQVDEQLLTRPALQKSHTTALHIPLYFWLVDSTRAIFSIPALTADAVEYGFSTSDNALIQALLDMRKRYRNAPAA